MVASFYEAVLRPWVAYLRLRWNNWLFYAKSLREQVEMIFAGFGDLPKWDWEVAGKQPQFTMATQCDETDHNYPCRRLEVEGYSHWYEHSDEGHTLKVCDDTRIEATLKQHADRLRESGATNSTFQLSSPNGNVVGLNRGRIGQCIESKK